VEEFKVAVANIMLKTLKNTSVSDGDILSAISQGLKELGKFENFD
jgi:hypothetical protein